MRIFIFLITIVSACTSTFKEIRHNEIREDGSEISLNKMVFHDGFIFLNSAVLGTSLKYCFSENTYLIELTDGLYDKYPKYIIEKGKYKLMNMQITFVPECKLFCDLGFQTEMFLCKNLGDYSEGKLVNLDSISSESVNIIKLNTRKVNLNKKEDKLSFIDSEYTFLKFTNIIESND